MNSQTDRCYHGGAFFKAIGEGFDHLERHQQVINADVLDAWFPPAPSVIETVTEYLPWLARTSPPTHSEGLIDHFRKQRSPTKLRSSGGRLIGLDLPRSKRVAYAKFKSIDARSFIRRVLTRM